MMRLRWDKHTHLASLPYQVMCTITLRVTHLINLADELGRVGRKHECPLRCACLRRRKHLQIQMPASISIYCPVPPSLLSHPFSLSLSLSLCLSFSISLLLCIFFPFLPCYWGRPIPLSLLTFDNIPGSATSKRFRQGEYWQHVQEESPRCGILQRPLFEAQV